jgi:hypothetical protein
MHSTKTIIFAISLLFLISLSECAVAKVQPVNYKDWLINMAINDGYKTVDNYVRNTFWYYLRGSTLLDYRVAVTPTHLNYQIIYMAAGGIFLINSGLDKFLWEIKLNNLVRINAEIIKYY